MKLSAGTLRECRTFFDVYTIQWPLRESGFRLRESAMGTRTPVIDFTNYIAERNVNFTSLAPAFLVALPDILLSG